MKHFSHKEGSTFLTIATILVGGFFIFTGVTHADNLPSNPTAPTLGETGKFVLLASQKITQTTGSVINNGDIGIENQARSYYEGFTAGPGVGQFNQVINGLSYAHDDTDSALIPVPYVSTIAFINQTRTDLSNAYSFLAADPNPSAATISCPIELGGLTLTRGVYKTALNVGITTGTLTLDGQGDTNSVWVFSIDGTLTTGAPGGNIVLKNGAQAKNIYWRVAGVTTIGANTAFYGNVFAYAQINALSGANIVGRLFSVNEQVTLIANIVTMPTAASTLMSADIINNSTSTIGNLTGATLTINNSGACSGSNSGTMACHVLNVGSATTTNGNLPAESDGFILQASSIQQTALTNYFFAKGWPTNYLTQINAEIAGNAPFFYFVSDGHGHYNLVDGFQTGLGNPVNQPLVIDDTYPTGIYHFSGMINGQTENVHLTVVPTLSNIAVITSPTKTVYDIGDSLNLVGLVVVGTYSDNSTTTESILISDVSGFNSLTATPDETLTVIYNGKTTTFVISVSSVVSTLPVVTAPIDQTFEATGPTTTPTLIMATSTDVSYPNPIITYTPQSFSLGTTTVIWTATDSHGNMATTTSKVIIKDTTAPIITLIGNQNITIDYGAAYTDQGATWSDAVDGSGTLLSPDPVNINQVGVYLIHFNFTDSHGNAATTTVRTVTVNAPISSGGGGGGSSGGGGGALSTSPCVNVIYSDYGVCVGGHQYRNFASELPNGCQLTNLQRAAASQICGTPITTGKPIVGQPISRPIVKPIVLGVKTYANGTIVKASGPKIYVMSSGKLWHIPNLKVLAVYTKNHKKILIISNAELNRLLVGSK